MYCFICVIPPSRRYHEFLKKNGLRVVIANTKRDQGGDPSAKVSDPNQILDILSDDTKLKGDCLGFPVFSFSSFCYRFLFQGDCLESLFFFIFFGGSFLLLKSDGLP